MSNIAIKGATTGTGTFTIESPATNTDRTLTLPDEAGTVVTTGGTGSVSADMLASTLDMSGKTVTLPASSSAFVHIKTLEGTNVSSLDFMHGSNGVIFDDTYTTYEFIIHYCYNVNVGNSLDGYPSQNGTGFTASGVEMIRQRIIYESAAIQENTGNSTSAMLRTYLNLGNTAADPIGGRVQIRDPYSSSSKTVCMWDISGRDNSNYYREFGSGNTTSAGRTYGFQFAASSGNTNAKISLYGIKE